MGMARPRAIGKTTMNLCLRLPVELLDQAHEVAKDRDLTLSQLVRDLLRQAHLARFGPAPRRSV